MGIDEAELKKANEEARNNPERSGRRNGRGEDRPREDSSPRPSADELPAPVAQADIDKMDSNTAMKGWTSRRRYIQKTPSLDASTKQRLEDEIQKLRERQQKANAAGGSK
jgi:hypothetical protein